jgi:ornithine cyclodeaminase
VILMGTSATEPLLLGDWLQAGQHVTSVGSDDHTKAELDAR